MNNLPSSIKLDADGFPILDEVVEEVAEEDIPTLEESIEDDPELLLAETLKAQLMDELEPRLTELVQSAFLDTVKIVAIQMKHQFEQDLELKLKRELDELIDQTVDQAVARIKTD